MKRSQIINGKVVNCIVVDPDNLPDLDDTWSDDQSLEIGMVGDNKSGFRRLPSPPHISRSTPDRDAAIQAIIDGDMVAAQEAMDKME